MSAEKGFVCFNAVVHVSNIGDTRASNVLSTLRVNPHFVDHERSVWKLLKASLCLFPRN